MDGDLDTLMRVIFFVALAMWILPAALRLNADWSKALRNIALWLAIAAGAAVAYGLIYGGG